MILRYKYGFEINEVLYGWNKGELHRLPQMINKRFCSKKTVPYVERKRKSGMFKGYELYGKVRKSKKQLEALTHYINKEVELIKDKDLPF